MQRKSLGIIILDFDPMGQLLIIYSAFVIYLRINGNKMKQCIMFTDFKKAYDSVRKDVIYNILIESGKANKNEFV
jgi:tRNA(His) 5'-end guanylyltransferase